MTRGHVKFNMVLFNVIAPPLRPYASRNGPRGGARHYVEEVKRREEPRKPGPDTTIKKRASVKHMPYAHPTARFRGIAPKLCGGPPQRRRASSRSPPPPPPAGSRPPPPPPPAADRHRRQKPIAARCCQQRHRAASSRIRRRCQQLLSPPPLPPCGRPIRHRQQRIADPPAAHRRHRRRASSRAATNATAIASAAASDARSCRGDRYSTQKCCNGRSWLSCDLLEKVARLVLPRSGIQIYVARVGTWASEQCATYNGYNTTCLSRLSRIGCTRVDVGS